MDGHSADGSNLVSSRASRLDKSLDLQARAQGLSNLQACVESEGMLVYTNQTSSHKAGLASQERLRLEAEAYFVPLQAPPWEALWEA